MKKKWVMLFAVALLYMLTITGIWGCSALDVHDGPIEWDNVRTKGKIIGFIDDSLVIVSDWRGWSQELATFVTNNGGYRTGVGHQGLRVYNYRIQEEGPRWIDSLDNDNTENFTYLVGQLSDSIIWGGNGKDSFSFWKLGEKPDLFDVEEKFDGCKVKFKQERMKIWLNDEFFIKGTFNADGDTCQYAILDTAVKMITYKRFSGDLKWIQDCDDIMIKAGDVYCLVLDKKKGNSFVMKNAKDSIFAPMKFFFSGDFWGKMVELNSRICRLENDEILCNDVKWTGNREFKFDRDDGTIILLK